MLTFKFKGQFKFSDKTNEEAITQKLHDAIDKIAGVSDVEVTTLNVTKVTEQVEKLLTRRK